MGSVGGLSNRGRTSTVGKQNSCVYEPPNPWSRSKTSTSARGGKGPTTVAPRTSSTTDHQDMGRLVVTTLCATFGDQRKAWLPLSQLPPGELRIDGRRVSQLLPALQGDRAPVLVRSRSSAHGGSKPGAQCPHAGDGPDRSHDGAGTGQCHQ